jgi:L-threonylcarbamoyladenylate synthase
LILDAGPTPIGLESTVVDITSSPAVILRPGGITREALEAVIGPVQTLASIAQLHRSPGTRYRHYSPKACVWLIEDAQAETLHATVARALQRSGRVGCLLHRLEPRGLPPSVRVIRRSGLLSDYAQGLFSALRQLDEWGVEVIVVEGVQDQGLGAAVMDRLRRAAAPPETLPCCSTEASLG